MEFSRPEYWSGEPFPSPGDLPNPGTEPGSSTLQADSSPAEPPGKPKNTGVGSLSLLQGIFQTQESNRGLLHSRQILYQLSNVNICTLPLVQVTCSPLSPGPQCPAHVSVNSADRQGGSQAPAWACSAASFHPPWVSWGGPLCFSTASPPK